LAVELSFKRNIGILDRLTRTVLGMVFIGMAAFKPVPLSGTWNTILWVAGIFMLVEAALGY